MKILVPVKRAVDYNVRIQIRNDGSGVVTDGVKHSVNPFDEIALEQAIRWQQAGEVNEVIAVTIGPEAAVEQLRSAAAFGCGRLIHVRSDEHIQPPTAARVLAELATAENIDIVLAGKQAIDDDCNQTGQMIAGRLGWSQATFASAITLGADGAEVTRELDGGSQTLAVSYPTVITADLRLCEPRYLRLPDIMRAKKQPIEARELDNFDLADAPRLTLGRVDPPPSRAAGRRVETVDQLMHQLDQKGLV